MRHPIPAGWLVLCSRALDNFRHIRNSDLLERVDTTRGEREIDGTSANHVALARISATLVKIDIVSATTEISGEQPTSQAGPDQNEFRSHPREFLTADYADSTDET